MYRPRTSSFPYFLLVDNLPSSVSINCSRTWNRSKTQAANRINIKTHFCVLAGEMEHAEQHKSQTTFLLCVFAQFMCLHILTPKKHISQITLSYICLLCSGPGNLCTIFYFLSPSPFLSDHTKTYFSSHVCDNSCQDAAHGRNDALRGCHSHG